MAFLAVLGFGTIVAVVGLVLLELVAVVGPAPPAAAVASTSLWPPPGASLTSLVGGALNVVFAFCGQAIFVELMASMRAPGDFPKAVTACSATMTGTYSALSVAGYLYLGQAAIAPITNALPQNATAQVASGLLFVHVFVAYLIQLNVLSQVRAGVCRWRRRFQAGIRSRGARRVWGRRRVRRARSG